MKYVEKIPETRCWHWIGAIDHGYGKFRLGKKTIPAHRASLFLFRGGEVIPGKNLACHKCDNTICVNPDHLFWGTHQDNVDDKMKKGRHNTGRGMAHTNARLTDENILMIRHSDKTSEQLAKEYGVAASNINAIRSGKRWAHIGGPMTKITGHVSGENHPMKKLDAEKVRYIRGSKLSTRALAEQFGLSIMTVHDVKKFKSWKHVKDEKIYSSSDLTPDWTSDSLRKPIVDGMKTLANAIDSYEGCLLTKKEH